MTGLTILMFLALAGALYAIFFRIYKYFDGMKMVATDDFYKQNGLTVDYKAGTISVKKYTYDVNKVTGISTTYHVNGANSTHHVIIQVDDLKKPVHPVVVVGRDSRADEFSQRICVALRKAGGPDFN